MHSSKINQVIVVLIIFNINGICSLGSSYVTVENKLYYINEDQRYNWFDALNECLKLKMNLVAIETSTKSEEINALVMETFGRTVVLWVGGIMIRNSDTRNYTWIATGQQFNYTYWKVNNPDFTNSIEYCIEIGWGRDMEWNDDNCGNKYGFICEENHQVGLKPNNTQVLENFQELTKSLDVLKQELQDHDQLKEDLRSNVIEREKLQQELTINQQQQEKLNEQLQQIMENEVKKHDLLEVDLQIDIKETQQFVQILQKQKLKLLEILQENLQKRQDLQSNEDAGDEEKQWNGRKYRDNIFQFIVVNH